MRVETQDTVDIETFKPASHVDFGVDDGNKGSKIKVKIEGRKSSRKRNNICYAEEEDTVKVNVPIHKNQRKKVKT